MREQFTGKDGPLRAKLEALKTEGDTRTKLRFAAESFMQSSTAREVQ